MIVKALARVRGLFAGAYPENHENEQIHVTPRGELIIADGLPAKTDLVRLGNTWQVMNTTGQDPATALPTTGALLALWNGEPTSGMTYVIDTIAISEQVIDTTQQNMLSIVGCLSLAPVTAPTDATAMTIRSLSGRAYGGRARKLQGGTPVTDNGWYRYGSSNCTSQVAVAGSTWRTTEVDMRGMILVPPGAMFAIHGVKLAASTAQLFGVIRWHEIQLAVKS